MNSQFLTKFSFTEIILALTCIADNLPMASELSLEAPDKSFVGFRLSLVYFASYHFFLYRSYTSQDCTVLDSIEKILSLSLSLSPPICEHLVFGDFNAHHYTWLKYSKGTDVADIQTLNFYIVNPLLK